MATITPPLKWHGGKHYLAHKIIALMPPHLHYVEPYFGGGAVLFARDPTRDWYEGAADYDGSAKMRGCSEVANDINGELMNFWDILKSPALFSEFQERLRMTPFSEVEFHRSMNGFYDECKFNRALAFFIRCRQSRQGLGKDFATVSRNRTRRGQNEQVSAWLTAIDGLPEVHARLKRVLILNRPALDVIRTQDGPRTLFFLDPPYLHETRTVTEAYQHEMSHNDHADLLATLHAIDGAFLLSGYRSDLYDFEAETYGWHRVEFDLPNNAAGGKSKRRMTECVWVNFEPPRESE